MSEWISVDKERPKIGQKVCCLGPHGSYFLAKKIDRNSFVHKRGTWRVWVSHSMYRILTHWTPLPDLPEGGEVDES